MTRRLRLPNLPAVISGRPNRPYLDAWLRRTRRELAASGALSQLAVRLAAEEGGSPESWRSSLRDLLDGKTSPSLDLVTRIDALLSGRKTTAADEPDQGSLW